jgi:hypothetical protein
MNGVRMNGVRMNGFSINGLLNDDSLLLMTYLVECALPDGHHLTMTIDDSEQPFYGALGLAPNMEYEALSNPEDQEWVTACLLARCNSAGQHHWISMRGAHPALVGAPSDELATYRIADSAFFGNIFQDGGTMAACALGDSTAGTYVMDMGRGAGYTWGQISGGNIVGKSPNADALFGL